MQECKPPRNSWLQTHQGDETRDGAGKGLPRIVELDIGLIDLPMPQKLTPKGCVCRDCSERQQWAQRAVARAQGAAQLYGAL